MVKSGTIKMLSVFKWHRQKQLLPSNATKPTGFSIYDVVVIMKSIMKLYKFVYSFQSPTGDEFVTELWVIYLYGL